MKKFISRYQNPSWKAFGSSTSFTQERQKRRSQPLSFPLLTDASLNVSEPAAEPSKFYISWLRRGRKKSETREGPGLERSSIRDEPFAGGSAELLTWETPGWRELKVPWNRGKGNILERSTREYQKGWNLIPYRSLCRTTEGTVPFRS